MDEKDIGKKAVKAGVADLIGKLSVQLTNFGLTVYLARLLEPSDFGLLALAMVGIQLSTLLYEAGLPNIIIQKGKVLPEQLSTIFYLNMLLGGACSLAIWLLAPYISSFFVKEGLTELIRFLCFLPLLESSKVVHLALARRELNLKMIAIIRLVTSNTALLVGLILALKGFGLWSLVWKTYVGCILSILLLWFKSPWKPQWQFNFASIKPDLRYGLTMLGSSAITRVFSHIETLLIGRLFSAETLGFFNRAKSFQNLIVKYASSSINAVFYPLVSRLQKETQRVQELTALNLTIISFFLIPAGGLLWLWAPQIILFLYGEKWLPAADLMRIIICALHMSPFASILANVLAGRGNAKAHLRLEIIKKTMLLVMAVGGYFYADLQGFLWATVIAHHIGVILNILWTATELQCRIVDIVGGSAKNLLSGIVAFIVMVCCFTIFKNTILISLIGISIYLISAIFFQRAIFMPVFKKLLKKNP